jgi:cell division protein FtsN
VAAVASGGGLMVQIGAFSSPAQADKGWNDVAKLLPGEMVGRTKKVEPVVKDTETLYRAYVGGFGAKAEAVAFCNDLKAAGHACIVK